MLSTGCGQVSLLYVVALETKVLILSSVNNSGAVSGGRGCLECHGGILYPFLMDCCS